MCYSVGMGFFDFVKSVVRGDDGDEGAVSAAAVPQHLAPIDQALREVIAEQSDGAHTPDGIEGAAPLLDDGYLDSMSSVKVLLFIEETYGVAIEEVELTGRLNTLNALVQHVAENAAPKEGP